MKSFTVDVARPGPSLTRLVPAPSALAQTARRRRHQGLGLGVNRVEPLELTLDLDEPRPDAFLLAGLYTLLDHERALQRLSPAAAEQDVDIVVGGPYSSGVRVGGTHFEYEKAPASIITKGERIKSLTDQYGISMKAAALQFCLAHPVVRAVIPGGARPSHVSEDAAALQEIVPATFWAALREEKLIAPDTPGTRRLITLPPAGQHGQHRSRHSDPIRQPVIGALWR